MPSKKRRRSEKAAAIHPRNQYAERPPDFALLASLYPSFRPFVREVRGRATIDWTNYDATRELTRILLLHDHGVHWWIPDGQLCPTVPNRSNYIHWIEDLLASKLIPGIPSSDGRVRGFDIGSGANCIYPLLGASLLGWNFVASDMTDVALEWATKNVESNPHLSDLIEVRNANNPSHSTEVAPSLEELVERESAEPTSSTGHCVAAPCPDSKEGSYQGPPVLVDVVKDGENFDFCMCNPPFFEYMEEACLNPKTSCGGTFQEMVCPGGEQAFITRIIEDSVVLKHSFRWFTSMVGRKTNLKLLVSKLRSLGVSIVKTTEFVQGQTARWGLAWSFLAPNKDFIELHVPRQNLNSFTLEGLQRKCGAFQVLESVESFFLDIGASCKSDLSSFTVDISLSMEHSGKTFSSSSDVGENAINLALHAPNSSLHPFAELSFRVSVFEQIPGTVLVKGSLLDKQNPSSGAFSSFFSKLEHNLKKEFGSKSQGHYRA